MERFKYIEVPDVIELDDEFETQTYIRLQLEHKLGKQGLRSMLNDDIKS